MFVIRNAGDDRFVYWSEGVVNKIPTTITYKSPTTVTFVLIIIWPSSSSFSTTPLQFPGVLFRQFSIIPAK